MRLKLTVLAASSALVAVTAVAQAQGPGQWHPMHDSWMWWMPLHGLFWLLALALLIAGVVLLVRLIWPPGGRESGKAERSSALDLLEARYAKGEIDREDYLQRKKDLGGD